MSYNRDIPTSYFEGEGANNVHEIPEMPYRGQPYIPQVSRQAQNMNGPLETWLKNKRLWGSDSRGHQIAMVLRDFGGVENPEDLNELELEDIEEIISRASMNLREKRVFKKEYQVLRSSVDDNPTYPRIDPLPEREPEPIPEPQPRRQPQQQPYREINQPRPQPARINPEPVHEPTPPVIVHDPDEKSQFDISTCVIWACDNCTLENTPNVSQCILCANPNPNYVHKPLPEIEFDETAQWKCPACTFLNEISATICTICSGPKEIDPNSGNIIVVTRESMCQIFRDVGFEIVNDSIRDDTFTFNVESPLGASKIFCKVRDEPRALQTYAFFKLEMEETKKLMLCNDWNVKRAFTKLYVDDDGDIRIESDLILPPLNCGADLTHEDARSLIRRWKGIWESSINAFNMERMGNMGNLDAFAGQLAQILASKDV